MANPGSFKIPRMLAQDLAIILEFVDPPQALTNSQEKSEITRENMRTHSPNVVLSRSDDDIRSSGSESEDEVEAQIDLASTSGSNGASKRNLVSTIKVDALEDGPSDSDISSSDSSSSVSSFQRRKRMKKQMAAPAIDIDLEEDGPSATTYIPSAHELPPTSIPVPPLPDPSALPLDPVEQIGEIMTILPDSVIVRGSGPSGAGYRNARDMMDAVLDEGSLLLFDDRTPLGYVWETFGPTSMPHYVVRIQRREINRDIPSASSAEPPIASDTGTNPQSPSALTATLKSSSAAGPDPAKLVVARPIYHISSLSNFVFPSALAKLKGSDASNIHDEEPAEYELEFSDDEAEAAHKRLRNRSTSRAPSHPPSAGPFDGDEEAMSGVCDDAGSLYGTSPYDFEDNPVKNSGYKVLSPSHSDLDSQEPSSFDDSAVREALMIARNSRHRRQNSTSTSISESSPMTRPSQPREHDRVNRGKQRERTRGMDRGRGRDRDARGNVRGRGRGRATGVGPPDRQDPGCPRPGGGQGRASSFSFDEYDPHMPRPPSPTSLAIARAIGQWADGTPFPYDYYSGPIDGTSAITSNPAVHGHRLDIRSHAPLPMPASYDQASHQLQGSYDPSQNLSQIQSHDQVQSQHMQVPQYGVAPHINPRFAQAFGFAQETSGSSSIPFSSNSLDTSVSHPDPPPGTKSD